MWRFGLIKAEKRRKKWEGARPISLCQSTETTRFNGVKSAFLRRWVPNDESLKAPNKLKTPEEDFKTWAFVLTSHHKLDSAMHRKKTNGGNKWTHTQRSITLIDIAFITSEEIV